MLLEILAQTTGIPRPPDVQVDLTMARFDQAVIAAGMAMMAVGVILSLVKSRKRSAEKPIDAGDKKKANLGAGNALILLGALCAAMPSIQNRSPSANQLWTKHVKAGNALMLQSRYDDAELEFQSALDALDEVNAYDIRRAPVLQQLGVILQARGEFRKALNKHSAALTILETEKNVPAKLVVMGFASVVAQKIQLLEFDEAEKVTDRALVFVETHLPPDASERAMFLLQQGVIAAVRENMDEAKSKFTLALEVAQSGSSAIPALVGRCQTGLASWHQLNGDWSEAEKLYRMGLKEMEGPLNRVNPDVVDALSGLLSVLIETGQDVEAEIIEKRLAEAMLD